MIITISGTPGSGKSTLAKFLEKKINYKRHYMGSIMREYAREHNMTLEELSDLRLKDPKIDNEVDEYQSKLAEESDNLILEGRTSWHFVPNSLKIFISVSPKEAAKRIFKDESDRNEKKYNSEENMETAVIERMENDSEIYKKYYCIDIYDTSNYDVVIDTTEMNLDDAKNKILEVVREHLKIK